MHLQKHHVDMVYLCLNYICMFQYDDTIRNACIVLRYIPLRTELTATLHSCDWHHYKHHYIQYCVYVAPGAKRSLFISFWSFY